MDGRLIPNALHSSASEGNFSPGFQRPIEILSAIWIATCSLRLVRDTGLTTMSEVGSVSDGRLWHASNIAEGFKHANLSCCLSGTLINL